MKQRGRSRRPFAAVTSRDGQFKKPCWSCKRVDVDQGDIGPDVAFGGRSRPAERAQEMARWRRQRPLNERLRQNSIVWPEAAGSAKAGLAGLTRASAALSAR